MPPPQTIPQPSAPNLEFPQPIVVTPEEARYWLEACDAFRGEDSSPEQLEEDYPGLTEDSACNWSIYGLTTQDWYSLEWSFEVLNTYIENLRQIIQTQTDMANSRYEIMNETHTRLQEATEREPEPQKGWFRR